jgi:hypothetical protein
MLYQGMQITSSIVPLEGISLSLLLTKHNRISKLRYTFSKDLKENFFTF